ncbi:hypothetical protein INR49_003178 [Caranx melampygus]|nr:hypothetical protein INR49_003178 [Caranx melampygus]
MPVTTINSRADCEAEWTFCVFFHIPCALLKKPKCHGLLFVDISIILPSCVTWEYLFLQNFAVQILFHMKTSR